LRDLGLAFLLLCLGACAVFARGEDWHKDADAAIREGVSYLATTVNADGSWGKKKQPAISALAALAMTGVASADTATSQAAVEAAMTFVTGFAREDGSVQSPVRILKVIKMSGYPVYTTSIALLAMDADDPEGYRETMKAARTYLKSMQISEAGTMAGGFGYDRGKRADLSNTNWATEALHKTAYLDAEPFGDTPGAAAKETAEIWSTLTEFLGQVQSMPTADNPEADGGLAYSPSAKLVSTGAMTYAGLKAMVYAKLDRNDPRVRGAMRYIQHHYTVLEEPAKGDAGLFYYYLTMAKALNAYGSDTIQTPQGDRLWRQELVTQIISLQREDGSWLNENGRYFEALPELVTSYAILALREALGGPS